MQQYGLFEVVLLSPLMSSLRYGVSLSGQSIVLVTQCDLGWDKEWIHFNCIPHSHQWKQSIDFPDKCLAFSDRNNCKVILFLASFWFPFFVDQQFNRVNINSLDKKEINFTFFLFFLYFFVLFFLFFSYFLTELIKCKGKRNLRWIFLVLIATLWEC